LDVGLAGFEIKLSFLASGSIITCRRLLGCVHGDILCFRRSPFGGSTHTWTSAELHGSSTSFIGPIKVLIECLLGVEGLEVSLK